MITAWRVRLEFWRYRRPFIIARGALHEAANLVVELSDGVATGRGESEPHESDFDVAESARLEAGRFLAAEAASLSRETLGSRLRPGAVRNAIDCALWDLDAKRAGKRAAELAGLSLPESLAITGTVSCDTPDIMAREAMEKASAASVLKIKLGAGVELDRARMQAVRAAAPDARLIVDANGGWDLATLTALAPFLAGLGVEMIEQPLPAGGDALLAEAKSPTPICADESVTDTASLHSLAAGYSLINIKLDKCGGLTEGLALAKAARAKGLDFMVGSNGGTSLAGAPAYLLAGQARYADIDSPLLLAEDRRPGLTFADGRVHCPPSALWG
jgi:L-alanine-DL-glutamate epimerase-like enolase superfamily enzyme